MHEDAIDVYNRHKANLLKSIYQLDDYSEEVVDYLSSLLNLDNHDIVVKRDSIDDICMFACDTLLKARKTQRGKDSDAFFDVPDELRDSLELQPENRSMNRIVTGGKARRALGRQQSHEYSRVGMSDPSTHRYQNRLEGSGLTELMHGDWPSARPDREEEYNVQHPWHSTVNPLLRKDPVNGRPAFVNSMIDYIKSGQASKDDALDRTHETHHSDSGAIKGIDKPLGGKSMPYIGPLTIKQPEGVSLDGEMPGNGIDNHALYERAFKKWKKNNPKEIEGLSEEEQREAHFDYAADKWMGQDLMDKEVDPEEGLDDEEIQNILMEEGPEALAKYTQKHAHSAGWLTYMMGLEWLEPHERTQVLDHLFAHGSDNPEKQSIELDDGTVIPMGRLKRNMRARSMPELNWLMRSHEETSPNVPANVEGEEDTLGPPSESGAMGQALSTYKLENGRTAEHTILDAINQYLWDNNKKHGLHGNASLGSLFGFDKNQRALLKSLMKKGDTFGDPNEDFPQGEPDGESWLDTLKEHALVSPSHELTKADALRLMGYDSNLNLLKEHDLFDTKDTDENSITFGSAKPLIDRKHLDGIMKHFDSFMGTAKNEKELRGVESVFTTSHNGPRMSDLGKERSGHFTNEGGLLRGRGDHWNKPFEEGGLPISDTQYRDFLHALTHYGTGDGLKGVLSLLGEFHDLPHDEQHGVALNKVFSANKGVTGMFGHLLKDVLGPRQRSAHTAEQVLSPFDQSEHNRGGHRIDQFGKVHWPRNRKHPNHTSYSKSIPLNLALTDIHPDDHSNELSFQSENLSASRRYRRRNIDGGRNFSSNWSTVTGTGKKAGEFSDSLVDRNARKLLRAVISHGGLVEAGSLDEPSGKRMLGAPNRVMRWEDMVAGKYPDVLPDVSHQELMTLLAPNYATKEFHEETYDLQETLSDMMADLDQAENIKGEKGFVPNPALIAELKGQIDTLKGILEQKFQESIGGAYSVSGGGSGKDQSDNDFALTRESEIMALENIVRDTIIPAMIAKDPSSFDWTQPEKTIANVKQAFHDGELVALRADQARHNQTAVAPAIRSEKQQSAQTIADKPLHMPVAKALRDHGLALTSDMSEEDILDGLGLPKDKAHKEYIRRVLADRDLDASPLKVMSVGDVLASGASLESKKFSSVRDRRTEQERTVEREPIDSAVWHGSEDHHELIDEVKRTTPISAGNRRSADIRAFTTRHPLFASLNAVDSMMAGTRPAELDGYGLEYHRADGKDSMYGEGHRPKPLQMKSNINRAKSIAHNLILFEEGKVGNLDDHVDVGESDVNVVGLHNGVEIHPPRSREGTPMSTYFASGARMHWGKGVNSTVASSISHDGDVEVGTETTADNPMLNPSDPSYRAVLGHEFCDNMLSTIDANGGLLGQQTSSNADGTMQSAQDLVKADLPKEIPLIEPYHKVFGVEDLQELSGFTGEWVVSVHHEGKRVKIKRTGSRIDIKGEDNEKVSTLDSIRSSLRALSKKNYVVDAIMNDDGVFVNDILIYDDSDVTDLPTRERIKLLRGQFDSHENVLIPSPQTLKVTDDEGLKGAVKSLLSDNKDSKLLFRDAVSTYMKGEEKHPKWALMTKSDDDFHIPFAMELDEDRFILHFSDDIVKYDVIDDAAVNPTSAIGELSGSDYTIRLAKSLETYWQPAFDEMLKEKKMEDEEDIEERTPKEVEDESAGIIEAKDEERILKPKMVKALLVIEAVLDQLEKGHSNMAGRGLGIGLGGDGTETPTGATSLTSEQSLPDWDMKKRPTEDPEKPEDYPKMRGKGRKKHTAEYI